MNRNKRIAQLQELFPALKAGDLLQSHQGGKIHHWTCGHRSRAVSVVEGIDGMTRQQAIEKFGSSLCGFCFPEIMEGTAPAPKPKAQDDDICPGSGTRNWINGSFPEVWRPGGYNLKGTCKHCGQVVRPASNMNPKIRKHKLPK